MKTEILGILFIILLMVCSFQGGYILKESEANNQAKSNEIIENIEECENLTLKDSVTCFRDYINSFYNYTIRDERNYTETDGTLEDIKINGGDCYDYTNIYYNLAISNNLMSKKITFYPENGTGHSIALIYDKDFTGYCLADTIIINCYEFENG